MVTLDTSAVFPLCNRADPDHHRIKTAAFSDPGPRFVPAGILAEIAYLLEARLGMEVLAAFLQDLERGVYTLDCGEGDFPRIRDLVSRYANLPLGFPDASVVACAERRGGRVLTLDERDFRGVEAEGKIELA